MTDSDFISKAVGERVTKVKFPLAAHSCKAPRGVDCPQAGCKGCKHEIAIYATNTDDPAAWPNLLEWIEEQGLARRFTWHLRIELGIDLSGNTLAAMMDDDEIQLEEYEFPLIRATEAQKSRALVSTLEERDNAKDSD